MTTIALTGLAMASMVLFQVAVIGIAGRYFEMATGKIDPHER